MERNVKRAGEFKIVVESISEKGATFLDVDIFRNEAGGVLHRMHIKPSSIWAPLSIDSVHAPSVHLSWPASMVRRFYKRFSDAKDAQKHVDEFIVKLNKSCGVDLQFGGDSRTINSMQKSERRAWIVFPYRHEWKPLQGIVASFKLPQSMQDSIQCKSLGIAWSLGSQHLVHAVRRKELQAE